MAILRTAENGEYRVDARSRAAVASLFAAAGPGPTAYLLRTARQRTARAGELLVGEEQTDRAGVLIDGMLRTVVSLPDGRAATIHYPRPVQLFGLPTIFYPVALSVHAVRKSTVVELEAQEVRRCAREFPDFGLFLNRQMAAAVGRVPAIIEAFGFRTVSQRVAAHLISLSEPAIVTGERTAHVTQVALAEYVGTAREVVSRCLQALSDEGLVAIGRGWIRITNEAGLQRLAG
jgi:CRP/FNR family transcriptional regulator